ncbi:MAG: hypothetical protein OXU20_30270 [Myxococcales bacterium]|nr:hypothetical protein [Myxococcales bacterium]
MRTSLTFPALLLLALTFLPGCSYTPFTTAIRRNNRLGLEDLKKIQFYNSGTIVLRRRHVQDIQREVDSKLSAIDEVEVHQIVISRNTPCVVLRAERFDSLAASEADHAARSGAEIITLPTSSQVGAAAADPGDEGTISTEGAGQPTTRSVEHEFLQCSFSRKGKASQALWFSTRAAQDPGRYQLDWIENSGRAGAFHPSRLPGYQVKYGGHYYEVVEGWNAFLSFEWDQDFEELESTTSPEGWRLD